MSAKLKPYPCGAKPQFKGLAVRLRHYKQCQHPGCVARIAEWNRIVAMYRKQEGVK